MLRFFQWLFSAAPFDCLVTAKEGVRFHNEPTCEKCEYSLNGLPAHGKCPECGTAYDAASRFRKLRRPIWGRGVLAVPLVLAFVLFAGAAYVPGLMEAVRVLGALAGMLSIFVGNGVAVGWFIRWIVIQARLQNHRWEPCGTSKIQYSVAIALSVILYVLILLASLFAVALVAAVAPW